MCGILCHFTNLEGKRDPERWTHLNIPTILNDDLSRTLTTSADQEDAQISIFDSLVPKVLARGSDYCNYTTRGFQDIGEIEYFSSVLSLRPPLTEQPFTSDNSRYIIQFNGELYNQEIDENGKHSNDIVFINNLLTDNGDIFKILGCLEGEFAYCITDVIEKKLYFGKDQLGKKSLGYYINDNTKELYVSSVIPTDANFKQNFTECRNAIVYIFDLTTKELSELNFDDSLQMPNSYKVENFLLEDGLNRVEEFETLITNAVKVRIETIFPIHEAKSKFGLLFSGGIDCTILAALAAALSPSGTVIDLLNVSFHNTRTNTDPANTPDRKLALKSWYYLQTKYKNVTFNLVEANVTYEEYQLHRKRVIDLIYPNDTEMDLSIAIAFYFASRGKGQKVLYKPDHEDFASLEREDYHSDCKVLLSGLGADELFGGYTRHERVFTGISNQKKRLLKKRPQTDNTVYDIDILQRDLRDELQLDLSNLYIRNLSRDDKVISCWSKEIRYPFLDTHVIEYVTQNIPLNYKLRYEEESGEITRKYTLRLVASSKFLGLDWVADEPKRAIQFGAKSAKMELNTGGMKGTDKLKA